MGLPRRRAIGQDIGHMKDGPTGVEKGDDMAENEMLAQHRRTWNGFVKLITYSTVAVIITLALMAIFLL